MSCVKQEDIVFHGIDSYAIKSTSSLALGLDIENNSGSKITVKSMNLALKAGNNDFAKIILKDKLIVSRKSHEVINTELAYKIHNPLSVISLMGKGRNLEKILGELTVTGEIHIKAGLGGKKLKFKNTSFKQILLTFGVSIDELHKTLNL